MHNDAMLLNSTNIYFHWKCVPKLKLSRFLNTDTMYLLAINIGNVNPHMPDKNYKFIPIWNYTEKRFKKTSTIKALW